VHVDAYRLSSPGEIDDLDLEPVMPTSVTVVEWARGVADHLHADPLVLTLRVLPDETRQVTWQARGARWRHDLSRVAGCGERSSSRTDPDRRA
jgi:tRNA threonylcarbamoyladenosine biosynthesis protein TsaE